MELVLPCIMCILIFSLKNVGKKSAHYTQQNMVRFLLPVIRGPRYSCAPGAEWLLQTSPYHTAACRHPGDPHSGWQGLTLKH